MDLAKRREDPSWRCWYLWYQPGSMDKTDSYVSIIIRFEAESWRWKLRILICNDVIFSFSPAASAVFFWAQPNHDIWWRWRMFHWTVPLLLWPLHLPRSFWREPFPCTGQLETSTSNGGSHVIGHNELECSTLQKPPILVARVFNVLLTASVPILRNICGKAVWPGEPASCAHRTGTRTVQNLLGIWSGPYVQETDVTFRQAFGVLQFYM